MKLKNSFLFLILLAAISFDLEGQVMFQKTYGGSGWDVCYSAKQTFDGGYIAIGGKDTASDGHTNIYLVKLNQYGDTTWTNVWGCNEPVLGNEIIQLSDSGYVIMGSIGFEHDILLIRSDKNGAILWSRIFVEEGDDYVRDIIQTFDGDLMILADRHGFSDSTSAVCLIKTDIYGDTIWTKFFIAYGSEYAFSIEQTSDYGYVFCGSLLNSAHDDAFLMKTDSLGNLLWTKTFGGPGNWRSANVVRQTNNGDLILAGSMYPSWISERNIYVVKTNSVGDTLWTRSYGGIGNDAAHDLQITSDYGFIIAGSSTSFGAGDYDNYLLKIDSIGNPEWGKTYGSKEFEYPQSIEICTDGGILVALNTNAYGAGKLDMYLIKTDEFGNSECYENVTTVTSGTQTIVSSYLPSDTLGIALDTILLSVQFAHTINCSSCGVMIYCNSCPDTVCFQGDSVNLIGYPNGGNFLGQGIINNIFYPSLSGSIGNHMIEYSYYDSSGCGGSFSMNIYVSGDYVSFQSLPDTTCLIDQYFPLDGYPSGGLFQGPGISFDSFNPILAGPGLHIITYSVTNSDNCTTSVTDSVYVEVCSSIEEMKFHSSFFLTPNPTTSHFTITSENILTNATLEIFNTIGEKVFEQKIQNTSTAEINLPSNIFSGIYFVKLTDGEKFYSEKLVVQK